MDFNSPQRAMRYRQVMHTPVSMLQLSCHKCKVPPSFSFLSCLQTPAATLFCSGSKTCSKSVVQVCDIIPSILPWRRVAAVSPQEPAGPCSSCVCATRASPGCPTGVPTTGSSLGWLQLELGIGMCVCQLGWLRAQPWGQTNRAGNRSVVF